MKAPKAVSRVPRWARNLALAIEIRFGNGKAATAEPARGAEEDAPEPMLVMEEGELLAAYRATGDVGINVEDAAGDRVIKPWQDLESFTTQDLRRMEWRFRSADLPGLLRFVEAAEEQAGVWERLIGTGKISVLDLKEAEYRKSRKLTADPRMVQVVQMAREMRGLG
jgi:hypothetical protein